MARSKESMEAPSEDPRAARGILAERATFPAAAGDLNQALEHAGRVADFMEFGELLTLDALKREESCGGHFRDRIPVPRRRGPARR